MNADLPITLENCDGDVEHNLDPGRSIVVVPKTMDGVLTDRQLVDYKDQRVKFLSWLLNVGKNPHRASGYAPYTVYSDAYRTARFDKWVWQQHDEYKYPPDEQDAHDYIDHLTYSSKGQVENGKLQEGIEHLNKWLQHTTGEPEWEFKVSFRSSSGNLEPRDYLSAEERRAVRQAALNAGNIPAYNSLSPAERRGWKQHISKILGKPYEDVTPEDWGEVDGWEVTSLVWASLDAGFRPDEVGKAKVSWVDTENGVLRIPHEDSSKNEGNWTVTLTDRTTTALQRWLRERENRPRYDDSELLWLTSHGNPHGSKSLSRLIKRLCDEAGIDYENRQMSWYTIRHSVGTHMAHHRDLKAAKSQLRHKSPKTTMQYDNVSVEDRRDALDKMG
ncbi:integrase [Halorubrum tailed phage 7]|uniref:integrase n=1 Tax=Halorubrum tailed phage 7 TaxID=2847108 RepID=UPI0003348CFB|nr:integrase [Halorubrum tailed phage 7]AGM10944.1 integrase [Halorubrum tailed phage 7]